MWCLLSDRSPFFRDFCSSRFFLRFLLMSLFFCDVCSDRFFFRDVRSSRFFLRLLFESLFFFAIFVHVSCKLLFKSLFFCDFRPGRFFAIFAHVPFFADAFQTHFSRISFEKVRQRQSPNAFLQVANRIFEHNLFIAQLQKSDFAGHRFFLAIFVPIAFLRLFFGGRTCQTQFCCISFDAATRQSHFPKFWNKSFVLVTGFHACCPFCCMQATRRSAKGNVVAKNAAKRVLPQTGSWPEGKVSRYSHILCAVVQWGLDASTVPAHSNRCPWQVAQGKVISADRGKVLHVEDS